MLTTFTCNT